MALFRSSTLSLIGFACGAVLQFGAALATASQDALSSGFLGLYPAQAYQAITGGRCNDCGTPKQALWYFEDDLIAVPKPGVATTSFAPDLAPTDDLKQWLAGGPKLDEAPFMVWLGSPLLAIGAKLAPEMNSVEFADGRKAKFAVTPKIASNLSYFNKASAEFFAQRPVRLRGKIEGTGEDARFVARVIWPEDYRVNAAGLKLTQLAAGESLADLIKAQDGGARSPFATRLIWERAPGAARDWNDKAVLGFMLNGAQGDDDEAHGGHFAIVTGWHRDDGQWADWMVNNFYNLGSFSEKGITASMLPIDNYMMDLNSGQSYYRPSYMLVAVLRQDRAARLYQGAISRVFAHFYRHDIEYDHAHANCAGLSIGTLNNLGFNSSEFGATSYPKAAAGYFYSSFTERDFASGRKTFNYLTAERSRLYPRMAFETAGDDLLKLLEGKRPASSGYEQMLKDEVEAIVFVRIPQIPSTRAFGTYPVASFDEYMARVPEDRAQWKIVPVDPRPFPEALRPQPVETKLLTDNVIGTLATTGVVGTIGAPVFWWRRRARRRKGFNS